MKDWNVIVLGEFISLIYSTFYNISLTEASQIYRMDDEIYTNPLLPGETDKSPLNGRWFSYSIPMCGLPLQMLKFIRQRRSYY